jgi:hypothetical protein
MNAQQPVNSQASGRVAAGSSGRIIAGVAPPT